MSDGSKSKTAFISFFGHIPQGFVAAQKNVEENHLGLLIERTQGLLDPIRKVAERNKTPNMTEIGGALEVCFTDMKEMQAALSQQPPHVPAASSPKPV